MNRTMALCDARVTAVQLPLRSSGARDEPSSAQGFPRSRRDLTRSRLSGKCFDDARRSAYQVVRSTNYSVARDIADEPRHPERVWCADALRPAAPSISAVTNNSNATASCNAAHCLGGGPADSSDPGGFFSGTGSAGLAPALRARLGRRRRHTIRARRQPGAIADVVPQRVEFAVVELGEFRHAASFDAGPAPSARTARHSAGSSRRADPARCRRPRRPDRDKAGSATIAGCPPSPALRPPSFPAPSSGWAKMGGGVGGSLALPSSTKASRRRG